MQIKEASKLDPPLIIHQCSDCRIKQRSKPAHSVVSSVASNNQPILSSTSSIDPTKMSSSATGKDVCQWTAESTNAFLDILLQFYSTGKTTGKTVRETVWLEVLVELNKRTSMQYALNQIKDKHKRMKKEWSDYHQIVKSTHGKWNPQQFTIDVTPEELAKVKDNVAFNRVQKRGMKRYDEMTLMWAEGTATGGFARSSNDCELSIEEERGMQRTQYTLSTDGGSGGNTPFNGKRRFDMHSPYPIGSTSSSSSKRKIEDLQCAVLMTMLEEPTVTGGVTEKWTPEECLADVRLVDGVTPMDVVIAGAKFADPVQRTIYMGHTPDEKLAWINMFCRNI